MYKVMVIDDEEIVRLGIRNLIDWEEEGYYICAEGKDGRDGLAKLLEFWPKVVLVDIKMPGLSGLELIKEARDKGFEGHFIILTGFSEFEFARTAISLGVKEYLLKPIDEDELLEILCKLRREIQEKEGEQAFHDSNEGIAREEMMRRLLLKLESKDVLLGQLKKYRMDFENQIFCAAVIQDKEFLPGQENHFFLEKMDEFTSGQTSLYVEKVLMENCIVLIQKGMDYQTWAARLERRNDRVREKFGQGFSIAVGHNVSCWYDIAHSYEFANFLLKHRFLLENKNLLTVDSIEGQVNHLEENPTVDYYCLLIEVGDMEGLEKCVKYFRHECIKSMMSEMDIKIKVMYYLMKICEWVQKDYDDHYSMELLDQINQAQKLDELMELYLQVLQELCIKIGSSGSETVIKRMYYYMEKNYQKDLKLEGFAQMFHYNSNYLGKIFRREIGDSFNNILDTIRITNAKRLLAETDLKVYQISEQVGYSSIDYFYLKFKKYVGMSPKEYKKQIC